MKASCPALLIAAPASGCGKTTVTAGLARLHTQQGRKVRVFKVGPDFLDPLILQRASGHPVYNLDLWMVGERDCAHLLSRAAAESDLILIEAVMGLYDGEPSAADIARRFAIPIVSVIDASAMAQTFGALVCGLTQYDPSLTHHGVLANRVASSGHEAMLRSSVRPPSNWLGAMAFDSTASMPERHLGLVNADEVQDLDSRLDRLAQKLADTGLATLPAPIEFASLDEGDSHLPPLLKGRRVAIAKDAAFCFLYEANLDCLRRLGAELTFFSPLKDRDIPSTDALYLPGGYPELHAARLAANVPMRESVRRWCDAGKPVFAECGGMLALFDSLIDGQSERHDMWGVLSGTVKMQSRLAALGLQSIDIGHGPLRGHTFHYSTVDTSLAPVSRGIRQRGGSEGEAVYRQDNVIATYCHAYFSSNPVATAALFGAAS